MKENGMAERPDPGEIWVRSDIAADGTYVVSIEASDDVTFVVDRDRATAYAWAVLAAVGYACYDAAVYRQLHGKLGIEPEACALMIGDLREDRPPVDEGATKPLAFTPCVSSSTGRPYLMVALNGTVLGQWSIGDAREHVLGVFAAVIAADLDASYYRALTGTLGLEPDRARNVVHDIDNHRDEDAS